MTLPDIFAVKEDLPDIFAQESDLPDIFATPEPPESPEPGALDIPPIAQGVIPDMPPVEPSLTRALPPSAQGVPLDVQAMEPAAPAGQVPYPEEGLVSPGEKFVADDPWSHLDTDVDKPTIKPREWSELERMQRNLQLGGEQVIGSALQSVRGTIDAIDALAPNEVPGDLSKNIQKFTDASGNEWAEPPGREGLGKTFDDLSRMAPQFMSTTVAAMAGGVPLAMLAIGSQIAGGTMETLDAQGVDPIRSFQAGIINAAGQAGLEALPVMRALKVWKPGKGALRVMKEMGAVMGMEGATEFSQSFIESATEIWGKAKKDNKDFHQQLDQFITDLPKTAKQGLHEAKIAMMFAGMTTGVVQVADAVDPAAATREKIDTAVTTQLDEALKTNSISPEAARVLIDEPFLKHLAPQVENLIKKHGPVGGKKPVEPVKPEVPKKVVTTDVPVKKEETDVKKSQLETSVTPGNGLLPKQTAAKDHLSEKYKDIYDLGESDLPHTEYQAIIDERMTSKALDVILTKDSSKAPQVKAAIADLLGDLEETYKYESHAEGQAKERYIDSLLATTMSDKYTKGKVKADIREVPKAPGVPAPVKKVEFDDMVKQAALWKGATQKVAETLAGDKKAAMSHMRSTTKGDLDAYLMKKFGISETEARDISNELTHKNIEADISAKLSDFKGEPWNVKTEPLSKSAEPVLEVDRRAVDKPPKTERREGERRTDFIHRKHVSEMTMEERETALLTSELTGLKNKRAYKESKKKELQASIDIDSLKWVNDNFGHKMGDALLKKMGDAMQGSKDAYHVSGDEFVFQGTHKEIDAAMAKAKKFLESNPMDLKGSPFVPKFSYATDKKLDVADKKMLDEKLARELAGKRAERGATPPDWKRPKGWESVDEKKARLAKSSDTLNENKAYKAGLLAEVSAALKKARKDPLTYAEPLDAPKVKIGGTFNILNNVQSLEAFNKSVNKFAVTPKTPLSKIKPKRPGVTRNKKRMEGPQKEEAELLANFKKTTAKGGTGFADTGGYASDAGQAAGVKHFMELPEIHKLFTEMSDGQHPAVMKALMVKGKEALGVFTASGEGRIRLRADIFKDPKIAAYVFSHEVGHWVDYMQDKTMARGNLLGRMAGIKGHFKHTLPNAPGAPGPLTNKDRARMKYQAKKNIEAKGSEVWIDEVIRKESPITPDDVMAIWKSTVGDIDPDLQLYVAKLNRAQKKAIMKDALKGIVGADLQKFAKTVETKTGKKIKEQISDEEMRERIRQKYIELINAEIEKRRLFDLDEITAELEALTMAWKPFDPKANAEYTKYRFSSPELYADAFSVLINKPGMLKSMAPKFYEGFFNYLQNKPKVEKEYLKMQAALNQEPLELAKTHLADIYKMFAKASVKRQKARIKAERPPVKAVDFLMKHLWDRSHSVLKIARSLPDDPKYRNAKLAVQELQHMASPISAYLDGYNKAVLKALEEKGVSFEELNATAFYKRIAEGDRGDKANPLGMTQPVARRDLTLLGREIWGDKKFEKIEGVLKKFRDLREQEFYPVLRESNILKPDIMEYIEKNKHHVKWDVADYFDKVAGKGIGGKIYQQIGTLKDIDHPIVSTMFQDVSLLRAAKINLAKQDILEMLKVAGAARRIKPKYSKTARAPVMPKLEPGKGVFTLFETSEPGVPHHYEVDVDIASLFEFDPVQAQQIVQIARVISQPLREAFVGKNIPWMVRNIPRDFLATVKNVPGLRLRHIPRLMYNYFMVMGEVKQAVFNRDMSARIKSMRQNYGLPTFRTWSAKDQTFDVEIDRLLADYRIIPKADAQSNAALKAAYATWEAADNMGLMSEVWGKVAADRFLETHKNFKMTPRQRAQVTRELAGTPDAKQRSAQYLVLNNLYMFSEMRKSGIRQMFTAFKADKAGYVWKTLMVNVLPKAMKYMMLAGGGTMALALYKASGGDDNDVINQIKESAKVWTYIPEHDKMMYDCVPLFMTDKGKAAYLAIPKDYEGQIFGSIGYLLAKSIMDNQTTMADTAREVYKVVEQQQPYSLNALIDVAGDWAQYVRGDTPEDWKGYKVVPRKVSETGGTTYIKESLPYMARHTWRSLGGGVIYKPGYSDVRQSRETYEKLLSSPPLNAIGTFLRFSDRGLTEAINERLSEYREAKAEYQLNIDQKITTLLKGGISSEDAVEILADPGVTKKKINKAIADRETTDPYVRALSKADAIEKAIIINMMLEEAE